MSRFILFLDVDGVLHACRWTIPGISQPDMAALPIDEFSFLAGVRGLYAVPAEPVFARLPTFEAVIRPHLADCDIVISSSWRKVPKRYEQLLQAFSPDVRARVIGATPLHKGGRPGEIYHWLKEHPDPDALPILIDDDTSHEWRYISDLVARIHPGPIGFNEHEVWLLEALLALTPVQVERLKSKLSYFNAMTHSKLRTVRDLTVFEEARPWPCFADFEATGLDPNSHPIEIAWSGPTGEIRSYLIQRDDDLWRPHWDPAAEALHGITRDDLAQWGRPAWEICVEMNTDLVGQRVYFDGGLWDRNWLSQLFASAGLRPAFEFAEFQTLIGSLGPIDEQSRAHIEAQVQRELFGQSEHRAGRDTLYLQRWYLHAWYAIHGEAA